MWDAAASYDASAMEPAAYDPAAASAACYGTADWSTYQYGGEAAAGFLEAPPGVDPAPPGVDEQQVALEQEWAIQAQEYADAAKADNAAGSADHQRVSSEGGVHAPVTATSSPDAAVAAGGSAKGQEDHSQYQGYDYTAYAGSYGYYGPNAAYYGNNGYQYGAGQQAGYGQADYYSSAYAAAAAVPKEIHNPFEDLGKPKADKADEAKAPLNRRGPVRRKIIMPISKKISEEQKLKSASSIAKQNNDSSTPVSGQDSTANTTVKPDKTMVKEVDANAENIMKTARAESEGAKNLNSSTAPSRSSSEKSTQEKENLLQAHNAAALKARDAVERKPINNQYALEMDREQKAATIQEGDKDDDTPLSDSDTPKFQREKTNVSQYRAALVKTPGIKDLRSTMTSNEMTSRSAAAEALAAAKAAAANIMQREGYDKRVDHRRGDDWRAPHHHNPRRGRGRMGRFNPTRYTRHRSRSMSQSPSRSRSRSRSRSHSRSRSRGRNDARSISPRRSSRSPPPQYGRPMSPPRRKTEWSHNRRSSSRSPPPPPPLNRRGQDPDTAKYSRESMSPISRQRDHDQYRTYHTGEKSRRNRDSRYGGLPDTVVDPYAIDREQDFIPELSPVFPVDESKSSSSRHRSSSRKRKHGDKRSSDSSSRRKRSYRSSRHSSGEADGIEKEGKGDDGTRSNRCKDESKSKHRSSRSSKRRHQDDDDHVEGDVREGEDRRHRHHHRSSKHSSSRKHNEENTLVSPNYNEDRDAYERHDHQHITSSYHEHQFGGYERHYDDERLSPPPPPPRGERRHW